MVYMSLSFTLTLLKKLWCGRWKQKIQYGNKMNISSWREGRRHKLENKSLESRRFSQERKTFEIWRGTERSHFQNVGNKHVRSDCEKGRFQLDKVESFISLRPINSALRNQSVSCGSRRKTRSLSGEPHVFGLASSSSWILVSSFNSLLGALVEGWYGLPF